MADEQFYTILTNIGKAKVANAALLSSNVTLKTLKVGDGNGAYYNPTEDQKDLKNTVYTCNVGSVSVDKDNPNWIVAETIIPGSVGGFTIREVGLFDVDGDMIAIGKYPETYKPVVANGASKDLNVRTIFEVSNAASVNLSINPSVIIATKEDINNLQIQIDENHSSLNEKANKNNAEFTGTMILNTKDVATYEKFEPIFLNGWQNATDNVWQPFTFYKIGNICFIVGILESSSLLPDGSQSPICINNKFLPKNHFASIVKVDNEWHDFIYDKTGNMFVTGQIPANKRIHFSFCIGEVN